MSVCPISSGSGPRLSLESTSVCTDTTGVPQGQPEPGRGRLSILPSPSYTHPLNGLMCMWCSWSPSQVLQACTMGQLLDPHAPHPLLCMWCSPLHFLFQFPARKCVFLPLSSGCTAQELCGIRLPPAGRIEFFVATQLLNLSPHEVLTQGLVRFI